jgi:hypothetical protein
MTKDQYLGFQRGPRPEQSDQRQPDQAASFSHKAEALRDSASVASRIRFPTGTTQACAVQAQQDNAAVRAPVVTLPRGFLFGPQMRLDQFPSGFVNALHGGISTLLHFDHEQGVFINLIGVLRRQDAAIDQCRDQRRKQRRRNQFGRRHGFEGLGLASSGTRGLAVAE